MFTKQQPDVSRLLPVPEVIYDKLGGIERGALDLLLLSWMRGGMVFSEEKSVKTPRGVVRIMPGQVWGSRISMQEDIYRAVGKRYSYDQIKYSTGKLAKRGIIEDLGMVFPETKGAYGKLYQMSEEFMEVDTDVDVRRAYNLFYYGNPQEFDRGEIVTAINLRRGIRINRREGKSQQFIDYVAREGFNREALTTIGRWRRGEVGDFDAPVFIPWITIDIDREDILTALAEARTLVEEIAYQGYDLNRSFVSFSGRRGFHLQISTDQFGSPIFSSADAARAVVQEVAESIVSEHGIEADPSVYSPHALVRLTGSIHAETGARRRTWTAERFAKLSTEEVFDDLRSHIPFEYPDPTAGEVEDSVMATFNDSVDRATSTLYDMLKDKRKKKSSGVISRILEGIDKGEIWHPLHAGRNKASFILACFYLERTSMSDTKKKMQAWNSRNTPPLRERELNTTIKSAARRVGK